MVIKVGDKIPDAIFKRLTEGKQIAEKISKICFEKTVLFLFDPGAFTFDAYAHFQHYLMHYDAIKALKIDQIVTISVNDPWVMESWALSLDAPSEMLFLPDHDAKYTKMLGLDIDLPQLGERSKRCAMIVKYGTVIVLNTEEKTSQSAVSGPIPTIFEYLRTPAAPSADTISKALQLMPTTADILHPSCSCPKCLPSPPSSNCDRP